MKINVQTAVLMLASGKTRKEIASEMSASCQGVSMALSRWKRRQGARTFEQALVNWAIKQRDAGNL